ncbi:glycosyltransferase family 2 protein [Candidatus Uabimicrobium amorphum]|uniref:Glycosyl transferase n=1 Tax=Uabimicrobium amorphum TaxID=2596890 RepID=A0A5S9IT83_UABAM|nr:glycosyltransferase family 2 protein [Candidatus Uabimicrobium amorphum]BBM87713.1 glycosyl transferase [Candidatus Uabimicrobium amorphum]
MQIKTAIILVNWNGWQDTVECVKSCQKLQDTSFHMVVVDNNSSDQSYEILMENFGDAPDVTILQSGDNLGFAGGNNFGIRYAQEKYNCQYFWLLNNDTVIEPLTLRALIDTAESDPRIGIVGSKIYYYDSNKLWFAGGKFLQRTGYTQHIGMLQEDGPQFSQQQDVDFISGCSLLISAEAIAKVGLMPEEYFLYFEDSDWNFAVQRCGLRVVYEPRSRVWHKISQSVGQQSKIYYYYMFRNSLVFIQKYRWYLLPYIFAFRSLEILQLFLKGNSTMARVSLKGLWHFFKKKKGKL